MPALTSRCCSDLRRGLFGLRVFATAAREKSAVSGDRCSGVRVAARVDAAGGIMPGG